MNIWIINPFDQLPNETDVPLRYWTLCRMLAEQGNEVIWWSSDFSHLSKKKRQPCPPTDGFSVRLIETPPYHKNIGFARLRNHKAFAISFFREVMIGLKGEGLKVPDCIVLSLPPLDVAEYAFRIRDDLNQNTPNLNCQVIVDVQDAWPEAFYQVLPKPLRQTLGPLLLYSLHRKASRAYRGADKITAVGQTYVDLAKKYFAPRLKGKIPPTHLCYLGADLHRFQSHRTLCTEKEKQQNTVTNKRPLKAIYMGSMGSGYDLETLIEVANRWKKEEILPWQIHFAGAGSQLKALKDTSQKRGLLNERVFFHGYLKNSAIKQLLEEADLGIVPNRPNSLVACPNKACEYAAASLPIISCLSGELEKLLEEWGVGITYKESCIDSLYNAFEYYNSDLNRLAQHSTSARIMATKLFNRDKSYRNLIQFITEGA